MSHPPPPTSSSGLSEPPSDIEQQDVPWQQEPPQAKLGVGPQKSGTKLPPSPRPTAARKSTRRSVPPKRFDPSTMENKPQYPRVQDIAHMKVDLSTGNVYNIGDEPPNLQGELTPMMESAQEIWERRYLARRNGQSNQLGDARDPFIDMKQKMNEKLKDSNEQLKGDNNKKGKAIQTLKEHAVKRSAKLKKVKKLMTAKDLEILRLKAALIKVEDQRLKVDDQGLKANVETGKEDLETAKDTLEETEKTSENTENTMEAESEV